MREGEREEGQGERVREGVGGEEDAERGRLGGEGGGGFKFMPFVIQIILPIKSGPWRVVLDILNDIILGLWGAMLCFCLYGLKYLLWL